ncbi:LOW QUALITY PROTEIN: transcription factor E4F1 [Boleophthalmus pectinirostris]|uniref:LOW QUALITY PROTEIN: transcription factor E4F1 n=1 Tax=Boleophthalmus pectinirostris TaxID=150288 RepID=UPI002432283E|nr:LOW QUALITY PROTEIN: transcription factor E4F1 [Boleophthalmus pectinirostris]
MSVKNDNTAETETEETKNGNETITIHTSLGDEDEDVHKCGRCQAEFSTLDAFIQHKLHKNCKRDTSNQEVAESNGSFPNVKSLENDNILGRGQRRKRPSHKATNQSHQTDRSPSDSGAETDKNDYTVNTEGRYLCGVCEKTFKTLNILRTHLKTHTDEKNFKCELCDTSFRTKGSLIRHNRRHTDERPYRCNLCGQSFRESGALTRHLKSLTPCTEKIRFVQYKEILVSKDGARKGVDTDHDSTTEPQEVIVVQQQPSEESENADLGTQTAVVNVVEMGSQEVLHQVHITMAVDETTQEQQVMVEQSQAEALAAAAAAGDSLICQAIINSGIALETEETVVEETSQEPEEITKVISVCPDTAENITEIHVKDELMDVDVEETDDGEGDGEGNKSKLHKCPHCDRTFKGINYLRFHVKGHLGYKPFKCTICQKDFLSGYLLKKHMEVHVSERRYKCGECGKLYKTIGHVREHMRAHSDERPYHCNKCDRGYKTKNALQVHQRTHGDEKPFVCQYCTRSFREKGSLVRHIRHHTGEKPYKCPKCGRGFAEHGTLNRHMRAKGGCQKEDSGEQQATAALISEDPHAVLVEFSSVVADTQEYIIKTQSDEVQGEQIAVIQDDQTEVGSHIMKVVQQIVSQSHGAGTGSPQIIVRNAGANEEGLSISDCGDTITIATPESLTEQVAMTLASAINDGTLLGTTGTVETPEGTVTVVTTQQDLEEGVQMVQQQQEEYVLTPEVEIQTFVV